MDTPLYTDESPLNAPRVRGNPWLRGGLNSKASVQIRGYVYR